MRNRTRLAATPLACLLLLMTTGCPPMMPAGNGNTNGGSNGNENGATNDNTNSGSNANGSNTNGSNTNGSNANDNGANGNANGGNGNTNGTNGNGNDNGGVPAELTAEQAAAIDATFNDLAAFYALFGSFNEMSNTRLALDVLPQIDTFGTCPSVAVVKSATSAVIAIDFKTGCETDATGGLTVAGGLSIRVTLATTETVVESKQPNTLSIDGVTYEGTLTFTQARSGGTLTLTGQTDGVTIEGVGVVSGSLVVTLNREGQIAIEGTLTLDDGTTTRQVTLDGVAIDPVANGNFLPSAGTIVFTEGGAQLAVTFTSDTPATREVQVQVNGSAAATYEVR
jgi:hypothetical protein